VLREAHFDGKPLLRRVKAEIALGEASYYVYLVSSTLVLFAACVAPGDGSRFNARVVAKAVWFVLSSLAHFHAVPFLESARRLVTSAELLGSMSAGILAAKVLADFSENRMSAVFSVFWHDQQQSLREALKTARETAAIAEKVAQQERRTTIVMERVD
jgi:hypothetical protein